MNIEWRYRIMSPSAGLEYEAYTLVVNDAYIGEIFHNSKARQERRGEPEWEIYIAGEEVPAPDTIKTVEEAKEFALAVWRLES